jgi:uncharacterized protein DUF7014/AbiJ-like protein
MGWETSARMPVFETYASRVAAAAKANSPDVYVYDELPRFLRTQISLIFNRCIGGEDCPLWGEIAYWMKSETESYSDSSSEPCSIFDRDSHAECMRYLQTSNDVNGVLSLIEFCAEFMANRATSDDLARYERYQNRDGIAELNMRFLRAGVGYQFENKRLIRIDSQYVHAEVVKEALRLLHEPDFREANNEFMKAHRHLQEGSLRDCNTAALRAMENVLKVICDARRWAYQKGDTVERLVSIVRGQGLFPDYLGGYFDSLIGAMKAGVPKIRDRQGGHGAAPGDDPVPDHIAAFALHLTAAKQYAGVRVRNRRVYSD